MIILKNDKLEVHLHPKGAEIHKIIGLEDNMNYMWKRDKAYWANSAPILFPIVGKVKNDTYYVDGKEYHLTQHGFARHNEFEVEMQNDHEVIFTLDDEKFHDVYPYKFKLYVHYVLNENQLECHIKVVNKDQQMIYFGVGGHPAFACPMYENESSNDYYVEFEQPEILNRHLLDCSTSTFTGEEALLLDNERRFFVRQDLFKEDSLDVDHMKSKYVA